MLQGYVQSISIILRSLPKSAGNGGCEIDMHIHVHHQHQPTYNNNTHTSWFSMEIAEDAAATISRMTPVWTIAGIRMNCNDYNKNNIPLPPHPHDTGTQNDKRFCPHGKKIHTP